MAIDSSEQSLYDEIQDDEAFRERYGERIGVGMSAVIYAQHGVAAKAFREDQPKRQAYQEAFALAVIEAFDLPAPKVHGVETFCERTVLLMDQVKGVSLLDRIHEDPAQTEASVDKVVELQAALHQVQSTDFRPLRMIMHGMIEYSQGLTADEKARLRKILAQLPDGETLCHGDFHAGNILFDGTSYTIIDWIEVACGVAAADACRTYFDSYLTGGDLAEMYLSKYCAATGRTRDEILAWLPVIAGSLYGYLSEKAQEVARQFF